MHDINVNAYKPETSNENRQRESEKLLNVIVRTFQFPQRQLKAQVKQKAAKNNAQGGSCPPYQFRHYITTSVSDNSLSAWQFLWP